MPYVCVYRGSNATEPTLLQHYLARHQVEAQVRGDLVNLRGEIPVGEAWPTVWVRECDQQRALELVRAFRGPRLVHPRWSCPGCGEVNEATFEWCWQCQTERPVESS